VLTTRVDELHRIRVLDRGGDDVLAKPYSYPELRARITALLRRARARRAPRMLRVGQLTIDLSARIVEIQENRLALPAKEYELLRTLAREPTRVLTKLNFEPPKARAEGSRGIQGLEAGLVIPLSPGRLWPLDYRAVSRGLGACRRATGTTWQAARRPTLARAHQRCERCDRKPPDVVLVVHHRDERGVAGRGALDQTDLTARYRGPSSARARTPATGAPLSHRSAAPFRPTRLSTQLVSALQDSAFSWLRD
jgi:hypothetical protein